MNDQPLEGILILSLTQFLLGPAGMQYLADMGADVIKIEPPRKGAWERNWAGGQAFVDGKSVFFLAFNRNQRGLTLNLKHPNAGEVLDRLLGKADVLVQNYRPASWSDSASATRICGRDFLDSYMSPRRVMGSPVPIEIARDKTSCSKLCRASATSPDVPTSHPRQRVLPWLTSMALLF